MANSVDKIIHRFVKLISEYETGGNYSDIVIPRDTQAYAIYPTGHLKHPEGGVYYVFGDGVHSYIQIRDEHHTRENNREYPVIDEDEIVNIKNSIENKVNISIYNSGQEEQDARITALENSPKGASKFGPVVITSNMWRAGSTGIFANSCTFTLSDVHEVEGYNYYPVDDITITENTIPTVIFDAEEAISGEYSPVCNSGNGSITIYARNIPDKTIIIPVVVLQ